MCIAAMFAACSNDADEGLPQAGKPTLLDIIADVEGADATIDTRTSAVTPSLGGIGQSFGVFICKDGTINQQYAPRTINMWGSTGGYRFENSETTFGNIYLLGDPQDDGLGGTFIPAADIYAYSPHITGTRNLENIPFSVQNQWDMMWAMQNQDSHGESYMNRDIVPDGTPRTIKLTFRHVQALVTFCFQQLSNVPDLRLSSIGISSPAPETVPLYTSASMNAMTGELFNLQHTTTTAQKISKGWTLDERYSPFYLNATYASGTWDRVSFLLIPVDVTSILPNDDDVVYNVDFAIWGIPYPRFQILRKHLKNPDDTYGLQRGRQYNFYFTIDNQLHLQGITIDSRWHDANNETITI